MNFIIGIIIGLLLITIINYFSNRPPRKLLELANLNISNMQLVSREETETQITEEYTDGKHTVKNYRLKPLGDAVKKDETISEVLL